ncbi:MAG TPA: efflux RND transporter periplasmic adaptor subunit [Vicinamibacterales bacterium]|nr:efflux RND transporter periplasmic adaptor subunit [Vicinamibacterales bacterium]
MNGTITIQTRGGAMRPLFVVLLAALLAVTTVVGCGGPEKAAEHGEEKERGEHHEGEPGGPIELSPEAVAAAGIQYAQVTQRTAVTPLKTTGTIEANQQRMQEVTPMVGGRIERVYAAAGDRVRGGTVLAVISSPEIAELHGKEIEARARMNLAQATLRRLRKLSELGAAAGKDIAAAEAEAATAQAEVDHIRGSLASLGSDERVNGHSISSVALRAPISGTITQRHVNAGAGVQAGASLFSIADLSTVWVIANVPESQLNMLRVGTPAEVRSAALGQTIAKGRVTYIDPVLNEETRTGRVRLEVVNPNQQLKIGTFVEVGFTGAAPSTLPVATELVVPAGAVQTVEGKTVVFVPGPKPGQFVSRDVELGDQTDGFRKVLSGLVAGDRIVTNGSFVLKTQMLKGEMGDHD